MRVVSLGTGTSHGIPMIACDCQVCTSDDPRDQRTRPSIHVEYNGVRLLVDTAPELRLQCLANDIRHVDAVHSTSCGKSSRRSELATLTMARIRWPGSRSSN